jgi:hypothetical protein
MTIMTMVTTIMPPPLTQKVEWIFLKRLIHTPLLALSESFVRIWCDMKKYLPPKARRRKKYAGNLTSI